VHFCIISAIITIGAAHGEYPRMAIKNTCLDQGKERRPERPGEATGLLLLGLGGRRRQPLLFVERKTVFLWATVSHSQEKVRFELSIFIIRALELSREQPRIS